MLQVPLAQQDLLVPQVQPVHGVKMGTQVSLVTLAKQVLQEPLETEGQMVSQVNQVRTEQQGQLGHLVNQEMMVLQELLGL